MKTFYHSISTRVICSGAYALDSKEVGKSGKERGFKLCTAISGDCRWNTIRRDPARYEHTSDGFCGYVRNRNGFRPSDIAINTCEEITATLGWWKRTNDIEMNMIKACIGRSESSQGGDSVTVYFGTLAREAGLGPLADISIYARPDEAFCDQTLSGTDSRVKWL